MSSARQHRPLELRTRRSLLGNRVGPHIQHRTGMGSEFDQLRDYQLGDPVRSIDWKSSARAHKLIVRSYCEDRNRSVIIALDVSASAAYGSGTKLKEDVFRQVAHLVAAAAARASDDLGVVLFHEQVERVFPLRSARTALSDLSAVMQRLPDRVSGGSRTLVSPLFTTYLQRFKRPSLLVLITDGLSSDYEELLGAVSQRHELVVIRISDSREYSLGDRLLVNVSDLESGEKLALTPPSAVALNRFLTDWYRDQNDLFTRYQVAWCDILVGQEPYEQLYAFFMRDRPLHLVKSVNQVQQGTEEGKRP